jgi:hypothetical protein
MSTPPPRGSLGWVTLEDGVAFSRAWLTSNTPGLFAAWERSQSQQQRLAAQIQQAAAIAESAEPTDPRDEYGMVRIQWAETIRYEASLFLVQDSSADQIWSELATLPAAERRTLDITDDDNTIISIVDLDGDGVASVLERSIGAGTTVDWGDVADSIDEQIAESPSWAALNAALAAAAAAGYDVAAHLPQLAEQAPLPNHDPAAELHYRLISAGAAPVAGDTGQDSAQSAPPLGPHEQSPTASARSRTSALGR